jgi:hypothetical protein
LSTRPAATTAREAAIRATPSPSQSFQPARSTVISIRVPRRSAVMSALGDSVDTNSNSAADSSP